MIPPALLSAGASFQAPCHFLSLTISMSFSNLPQGNYGSCASPPMTVGMPEPREPESWRWTPAPLQPCWRCLQHGQILDLKTCPVLVKQSGCCRLG